MHPGWDGLDFECSAILLGQKAASVLADQSGEFLIFLVNSSKVRDRNRHPTMYFNLLTYFS